MNYKIYKITNKINNKLYVGKTSQKLLKRFWHHCSNKSSVSLLSNEIRELGKENFSIEVILETNCGKEASILENYYIQFLNTLSPNGYNSIVKVNGKTILSDLTLVKQKNKVITEKQKESAKKSGKAHFGEKKSYRTSSFRGVKVSGPRFKACCCIDLKEIWLGRYNSEEEAAQAYDQYVFSIGRIDLLNFPEKIQEYSNGNLFKKRIKSSKYIGVTYSKKHKKWIAQIFIKKGQIKKLGMFDDEIMAAQKFNEQAIIYNKPHLVNQILQ